MMVFSFVAVWISSTLTISNSRQVEYITELQNMVIELTSDFTEARAQAYILYETHSDVAYEEFARLTAQISMDFDKTKAFISEHAYLQSFLPDIAANKAAFEQWCASIEALRIAQLKKEEEYKTYLYMNSLLHAGAGNAFNGQVRQLSLHIAIDTEYDALAARIDSIVSANRIQTDILNIRNASIDLSYNYSNETLAELLNSMDDLDNILAGALANASDGSTRTTIDHVITALSDFHEAAVDFGTAAHEVDVAVDKAQLLSYSARDVFAATERKMSQEVSVAVAETIKNTSFYMVLILVVSAVSAFLAIFIALITARGITKPLKFLAGYIADVAKTGDLSLVAVNRDKCAQFSRNKDEVGATVLAANSLFGLMEHQGDILKHIANKDISQTVTPRSERSTVELIAVELLDSLNEVMKAIRDSSELVSDGSRHIAEGAQDLARGSSEQADAIEQLSSSISSVSEKSKDNSTLAGRAATLGESIRQSAEKGSSQMDRMVQAVKEIREASQSIGKVISVIDSIAFQTNILALNAAVEAARAGQHGKGFAVVADEVRSLASKSAAAAKDTESLISNSIEKTELGAKLATETANSLAEIVEGIRESSQIVTTIAKSSEEQTTAIAEIDNGITQVAKVVQQTSETSSQSAATAEEMSSQSETLAALTTEFTLRDSDGSALRIRKQSQSLKLSEEPEEFEELELPGQLDLLMLEEYSLKG